MLAKVVLTYLSSDIGIAYIAYVKGPVYTCCLYVYCTLNSLYWYESTKKKKKDDCYE